MDVKLEVLDLSESDDDLDVDESSDQVDDSKPEIKVANCFYTLGIIIMYTFHSMFHHYKLCRCGN